MRPLLPLLPLLLLGATAAPAAAQTTLLNQPPVIPSQFYVFSSSSQVLAEDFVVGAGGGDLSTVRVWGVYWQSNTPTTDSFTVNVYHDSGGLPSGPPIASWTNPTSTRTAAGFTVGFPPLDVYEFAIDLGSGVSLAAGTYFIEVHNLPANGDLWAIVSGTPDPVAGIPSYAYSNSQPATTWVRSFGTSNLAFVLEGPSFIISLATACGGPNTLSVAGATPGGLVAVGYSAMLGSWAVPGGAPACGGALLDIVNPTRVANLVADGAGAASFPANVPPVACGVLHLQAFDVSTCAGSNVLSL